MLELVLAAGVGKAPAVFQFALLFWCSIKMMFYANAEQDSPTMLQTSWAPQANDWVSFFFFSEFIERALNNKELSASTRSTCVTLTSRAWNCCVSHTVCFINCFPKRSFDSTRAWPHWLQFSLEACLSCSPVNNLSWCVLGLQMDPSIHTKTIFPLNQRREVQLRYNYPRSRCVLVQSNWIKFNGAKMLRQQKNLHSVDLCPSIAECGCWTRVVLVEKCRLRAPLIFIKIFYVSRLWIYNATQNNRYLKANADLINSSKAISAFCRQFANALVARVRIRQAVERWNGAERRAIVTWKLPEAGQGCWTLFITWQSIPMIDWVSFIHHSWHYLWAAALLDGGAPRYVE